MVSIFTTSYAVENIVKDDARGRAWRWWIHACSLARRMRMWSKHSVSRRLLLRVHWVRPKIFQGTVNVRKLKLYSLLRNLALIYQGRRLLSHPSTLIVH